MMEAEDYQPYGEEWKNELMKMPKIQIIALYRQLALEHQELKAELEKKKYLPDSIQEALNSGDGVYRP
ncbi:MAG: hypothetical protein JRJ57_00285 [Deltaproteobacteria bacterium]|nr:hypothetical protein [Deltaproteobacteria bacterium]